MAHATYNPDSWTGMGELLMEKFNHSENGTFERTSTNMACMREWLLLILTVITLITGENSGGFRGQAKRTLFFQASPSLQSADRTSQTTSNLPDELIYSMIMEGSDPIPLHLVRDKFMHTPDMVLKNDDGNTISQERNNMDTAFYTDKNGHGSFACVMKSNSYGGVSCQLSALVDLGDETCYISPGSDVADCTSKHIGEIYNFDEIIENGIKKQMLVSSATINNNENRKRRSMSSSSETTAERPKRSIYPEAGFKVIEVAYVVDKAFMSIFYERNPDNTTAAELEADLYVTLLSNEINVYYSTIKEVSGGQLDIYVYPATFIYPSAGTDFSWFSKYSSGSVFYGSYYADNTIAYMINRDGFIDTTWDHAMFLTGLNIYYSSNILGYAYTSTICNPFTRMKFSVNEVRSYDIGRIAAHELGHALSMRHDESTLCPRNVNIMSPSIFFVRDSTQDTYYKFSVCSVIEALNHLSLYPQCTTGYTEVQFKEKFCTGLPGMQEDYLTLQCQHRTGWLGSTPCNTPTSNEDCYKAYSIGCMTSGNYCRKLSFVWNGTPCGTDKVCYKGDCVDSFNICDSTTTTTTTDTPTGTTAAPINTPTGPDTTTDSQTTTTTTSTTTTTTPTTTTTTPTTTTTTPTTTTTTPTTTTTSMPIPFAPCTCCNLGTYRRKKRCCIRGIRRQDGADCYCCGSLKSVTPPTGWSGPKY
ncbi:Adt-1p [Mactra antiquata]